jgi:hypothetical protein
MCWIIVGPLYFSFHNNAVTALFYRCCELHFDDYTNYPVIHSKGEELGFETNQSSFTTLSLGNCQSLQWLRQSSQEADGGWGAEKSIG